MCIAETAEMVLRGMLIPVYDIYLDWCDHRLVVLFIRPA